MQKVNTIIIQLMFVAVLAFIAVWYLSSTITVQGSVGFGNDYQATSTAANSSFGAQTKDEILLKTGGGSLGSIVITGANTGIFNIYNATTTNVNKRTGQKATTTILVASFPASVAAGTYVFDAVFDDGLLLYKDSGLMPTTTLTWR